MPCAKCFQFLSRKKDYILLFQASQYGYFERVRQLIEYEGVDVRRPDAENVTVLHWAAINNRLEIVRYVLDIILTHPTTESIFV